MDLKDTSRGELEVSSDWNVLLERGFTVGLLLVGRSSRRLSTDVEAAWVDKKGSGEESGDV